MLRAARWGWRWAGGCACTHLLISDVIRVSGGGLLHGHQTQHLQEVVLHHIPGAETGGSQVRGLQVGSEPALDPSPLARFWGRRASSGVFEKQVIRLASWLSVFARCPQGKERDSDPPVTTDCSDTPAAEFELGVGKEQPPTTGRGDPAGRWIVPHARAGKTGSHRMIPNSSK